MVRLSIPDERAEVARSRAMSEREREELLVMVVRGGMRLIADRPDREIVLGRRDPLPASTREALARLRAQAARRG